MAGLFEISNLDVRVHRYRHRRVPTFGPIGKTIMLFVTSACARRTRAASQAFERMHNTLIHRSKTSELNLKVPGGMRLPGMRAVCRGSWWILRQCSIWVIKLLGFVSVTTACANRTGAAAGIERSRREPARAISPPE